ncbi:prepilin-type N-terminal cleavage/methylation domain-containing protein [Diaphorobacter sp.]|uniref:prepilin-type N-terminal cleavage/methylation domain-containing protein n=1 Tax=Diaphorobacter sp. TaxID=1934310 RepID=UPI002585B4B4|nr:prepilin-type N-terminal cleavage/methylation domain-containing protein [Diaphorobacter sp.]
MTARRFPSASRGFTLVELLIVLVLLSLITLALASAMRTAAQTEERIDARLERMDDLRIATDFLRAALGRVSAQKRTGILEPGSAQFYFMGTASEVRWVGVMPARYGAGGRYHFRLHLADGQTLALQYLPWIDSPPQPNWELARSIPLATGVIGLSLQYADASDEPVQWGAPWATPDRMPAHIAVTVQTVNGAWPDLVVPLRALPASDGRLRGPVFGGSI